MIDANRTAPGAFAMLATRYFSRYNIGPDDGKRMIHDAVEGPCDDWEELGKTMAEKILSRGGRSILAEVYKET